MQKMVQDNYTIKFRRDTKSRWEQFNPVLGAGEPGLDLTTGRFKIGDGATAWKNLDYFGQNSYEIAQRNGFTGTEAEWLASLKGPKGDTGQYELATSTADGLMSSAHFNTLNNVHKSIRPDAIVKRGEDSQIGVPNTPMEYWHATSKVYVDDSIADAVASIPEPSIPEPTPFQDTGWRNITNHFKDVLTSSDSGIVNGRVIIKRVGEQVILGMTSVSLRNHLVAKNSPILLFPVDLFAGFEIPQYPVLINTAVDYAKIIPTFNVSGAPPILGHVGTTPSHLNFKTSTTDTTQYISSTRLNGTLSWYATTAFPTTLPGVPVT